MSALDELTNIDNWKAPISYSLVLESADELAQLRAENVRLVAELAELVGSVNVLKSLLSVDGEYSICRTYHEKMGLGDEMIVEGAIERIDKALASHPRP